MFENIERIKAPPRDVFFRDYVNQHRPVIITDLFDQEPIRKIDSLEAGRKMLGDMTVLVHEGHEEGFSRMFRGLVGGDTVTPNLDHTESTVAGYLDMVAKDPTTRLLCSDVPSSMLGKLMAAHSTPVYCQPDKDEDVELESMLWFGNAGNHSHLHFDGDYRQLLQYQVWGEKRVLLAPPSSSKKLLPVRNNCALSPEGLSEADNEEFVRYIHGYQAVVRTGETIFMPALMWHYFEYIDTSMSVTIRWRRNAYLRFLAEALHHDHHVQNIAWHFVDEKNVSPAALAAFEELKREYAQLPTDDPFTAANHMAQVFERVDARLNPDNSHGIYRRLFLDEIEQVSRRLDVLARGLYDGSKSEVAA